MSDFYCWHAPYFVFFYGANPESWYYLFIEYLSRSMILRYHAVTCVTGYPELRETTWLLRCKKSKYDKFAFSNFRFIFRHCNPVWNYLPSPLFRDYTFPVLHTENRMQTNNKYHINILCMPRDWSRHLKYNQWKYGYKNNFKHRPAVVL